MKSHLHNKINVQFNDLHSQCLWLRYYIIPSKIDVSSFSIQDLMVWKVTDCDNALLVAPHIKHDLKRKIVYTRCYCSRKLFRSGGVLARVFQALLKTNNA